MSNVVFQYTQNPLLSADFVVHPIRFSGEFQSLGIRISADGQCGADQLPKSQGSKVRMNRVAWISHGCGDYGRDRENDCGNGYEYAHENVDGKHHFPVQKAPSHGER